MKKLSREEYLKIIALFYMAHEYQKRWSAYEKELVKILGKEPEDSLLAGEVFSDSPEINKALEHDGFEVPEEFRP